MAAACNCNAAPLTLQAGAGCRQQVTSFKQSTVFGLPCFTRTRIVLVNQRIGTPAAMTSALMDANGGLSDVSLAVASGGGIALLAAALSLADPEKRRQQQAAETGGDEKAVVRNYFNTSGFERWKRIYGEQDDVNSVQLDIRQGHAQTVEKTLEILNQSSLENVTICDAGCGTGSLSIPLYRPPWWTKLQSGLRRH
jgi:hypothetical protein